MFAWLHLVVCALHLLSSLEVCNITLKTGADWADQECTYEARAACWAWQRQTAKQLDLTGHYLGEKERDDNEPDDIIAKGAEGLTEGQGLGEDSCSD